MCRILERLEPILRFVVTALLLVAPVVPNQAAEPRATVQGHLQTRPGGPRQQVEARVEAAPTSVTVVAAAQAELAEDELVLGLVVDGRPRAYPIRQLAGNEVVGDRIGNVPVAVTWCPLTGSGIAFARRIDERELTFDFVWGLVHDNLVITDRETGSVWSQLTGTAIDGPLQGRELAAVPSIQTTWAFWRELHAETEVAVVDASVGRPYFYFDSSAENAMSGMLGEEHDVSTLGLGLEVGPIEAFFPLHVLEEGSQPLRLDVGTTLVVVHHDKEGMTAWAEDGHGEPLPGVLAYEKGWSAFHPQTRVWGSQSGCGPRE